VHRHARLVALAISSAQCSLQFPLPEPLHQRAGLLTRGPRVLDLEKHPYKVWCSAEACATTRDASHPLEHVADPWELSGLFSTVLAPRLINIGARVNVVRVVGAGHQLGGETVETEHLSNVYQLPDSYIVTEAAVIVRCCQV
jgi:hypothetical protein